ncbi:CRISPR-associated helicase/endonuclease Cas3 [Kumtagia ephedrae]|uniref:CRISPR-associated helicase/endonuclease Cas3 n=1 Tax=Kumtagia ephedrae TaxID=2116701 RepID=A0A2P7STP4_9HYPH|nr:CRISPR-associated helicase/endonuclease Cas3 [Mesorhizobium ephedrae]PSJ65858.1 CRISPR-associated helicase/endonuclease Cas3 [Mesorhizobium ephedrae]
MTFYAHSGTPGDKSDWQPLPEHLKGVAELAAANARPFGMEKAVRVLGLFHDLGKYDPQFQRRLEGADIRVDHSTAGAAKLLELAKGQDRGTAELLAYAVLGHHAGLPDKHNEFGHCFKRRVREYRDRLDPAWKTQLGFGLSGLMPAFVSARVAKATAAFDLSVLTRFLFSCLVDADFKDTEKFYAERENRQVDRDWPALDRSLPDFIARFDAHMAAMPADGTVNRLRRDILAHVRGRARMAPGLFTLTVPTGGGKTLASLGFALDHAGAHGHRRIIYAIPFTSIVDQTADIFRKVLGGEHILEHHSAIDDEEDRPRRKGERPPTSRDRLKLAMQDWAAPVVVTTNVQLFESLFAARTSRARKLHNIAGSIIILDEAQTMPRHLLKPCMRMLDTMARLFGCTIVLCTATQPALGRERPDGRPGFPDGLDLAGRELAPDPEELSRKLRRTRIERVGDMDNMALVEALRSQDQALVIVNSRKHALELYQEAKQAGLDGLVHLTTRQCAAHRRQILADVRTRLDPKAKHPCRVIATSLIEAGVDVDFPRVWRAQAGWDQVMQAAGRCNREGRRERDESVVSVFAPVGYDPPPEIKALVKDTVRALDRHSGDAQSLEAIRSFFEEVYWRLGDMGLDSKYIFDDFILSLDGSSFAFRAAAEKFRMIESKMEPVIVAIDDTSRDAVKKLAIEKISSGNLARELQSYIVQTPPRAREMLIRNGHVLFEQPGLREMQFAVLKKDSLYRKEVGLLWDTPDYLAAEDMII